MAGKPKNQGDTALLDEPADEFYRPPASNSPRAPRQEDDGDTGEPFLRARRRVPVRRGLLPQWARTRWGRVAFFGGILAMLGGVAGIAWATRNFLHHDPRFVISSAASIQTTGNSELSRSDLLSVFSPDIGRNLFEVPLAKRRAELERIPWVERAAVMRILPNQLRVAVTERTPIAFVEVNGQIELVDASGVLLRMSPRDMSARHYSFPVVTGIGPDEALSMRAARMQIYEQFLREVNAGGENVSSQLSEVDLSDPEDVKATVTNSGRDLLLYFGHEDYLARWNNYRAHIAQWLAQYPNLASIDLRYQTEVVLKMADAGQSSAGSGSAAAISRRHAAPAKQQSRHGAQRRSSRIRRRTR